MKYYLLMTALIYTIEEKTFLEAIVINTYLAFISYSHKELYFNPTTLQLKHLMLRVMHQFQILFFKYHVCQYSYSLVHGI